MWQSVNILVLSRFILPRNYADVSFGVYMARHDADFTGIGSNDAGTIRPDETGLVLAQKMPLDTDHVTLRDALRDAYN